jgi:hypothetical protein
MILLQRDMGKMLLRVVGSIFLTVALGGSFDTILIMQQFINYLTSDSFISFLNTAGVWLILGTMAVAFITLWLEIRLPLNYYWGLPGHALRSLLAGLRIVKPYPVWGACYIQNTRQTLPLVACDLLDEQTHSLLHRTYSNHRGEFGFALDPGKYLLRAVKNRYRLPSLLDPENVEIYEVDESFVASVIVVNREVAPVVELAMIPVKKMVELNRWERLTHYGRMFLFQLGNGFLALDIMLSLIGWAVTRQLFYGLILAVGLVLLFIKLYLLEMIRVVIVRQHA